MTVNGHEKVAQRFEELANRDEKVVKRDETGAIRRRQC
jgi:hypothetical protein